MTTLDRGVLLDMNGTFLFDFDNFGPEQDFGATYTKLGYFTVPAELAHRRIRAAYDYMAVRYEDPAYYDRFPTVEAALLATGAQVLPKGALPELVDVFAYHELGHLPEGHAKAIEYLRRFRSIKVLSNLWAPSTRCEAYLAQCGLRQNFSAMTFSCDGPHIKPHPAIFERALAENGYAPPSAYVYVGDSWRCDVEGALSVGMQVVWLHGGRPIPRLLPEGVFVAEDLVSWISGLELPG